MREARRALQVEYRIAMVSLLIMVIAGFAQAGTINVPGVHPTIQQGIDAARNGDTVLVADGTYRGIGNKDLDFRGKVITLKSENGAEYTIIDCEGSGRSGGVRGSSVRPGRRQRGAQADHRDSAAADLGNRDDARNHHDDRDGVRFQGDTGVRSDSEDSDRAAEPAAHEVR